MKKRVIMFSVILLLFVILIVFLLHKKSYITNNQEYLIEIIYNSSGDMRGGIYNVSLDVKEKYLVVKEKESYDDPFVIKEYKISDQDINKLKEMITKYDFPKWEKYKMDERLFAYDAASKSITFTYKKDGLDWYNVNLNIKITAEQRKKLNDFIHLFLSLAKEEDLIKEYIEE